jgi:predicted cupin superfamily sugar epimerase
MKRRPRKPRVDDVIARLGLEPLPEEGGWFRQTYVSGETISELPQRYGGDRSLYTVIYYLITDRPGEFSSLHKLKTDEVWHFYFGDPARLLLLHPDGDGERIILGGDFLRGHRIQHCVPREVWQGCSLLPGGEYALFGTTMAPGFDPDDFTPGNREELIRRYPGFRGEIESLTNPAVPGDGGTGPGTAPPREGPAV